MAFPFVTQATRDQIPTGTFFSINFVLPDQCFVLVNVRSSPVSTTNIFQASWSAHSAFNDEVLGLIPGHPNFCPCLLLFIFLHTTQLAT